jgi:hypothetical protein
LEVGKGACSISGEKLDIRASDDKVELDLLATDALDVTIRCGDGDVILRQN